MAKITLRRRVAGWLLRSETTSSAALTGSQWLARLGDRMEVPNSFRPSVARELPAVGAAIRLLGSSISALPMQLHDVRRDGTLELVDATDPEARVVTAMWSDFQSASKSIKRLVASMALYGFGAVYVHRSSPNGPPVALTVLDPDGVSRNNVDGVLQYDYHGSFLRGPEGAIIRRIPREDLIFAEYEPSLNGVDIRAPLSDVWSAVRAGVAAQRWSASPEMLALQMNMSAQTAMEGFSLGDDAKKELLRAERTARSAGDRVVPVPPGYELKTLGDKPAEQVLLEGRLRAVQEVARVFQIPPVALQDLSHATYSNFAQAMRALASQTLSDLAATIASEMSGIIWPDGKRVLRFDLTEAIKPPLLERYRAHEISLAWRSGNEIRVDEGLDEVEGLDEINAQGGRPVIEMSPRGAPFNIEGVEWKRNGDGWSVTVPSVAAPTPVR